MVSDGISPREHNISSAVYSSSSFDKLDKSRCLSSTQSQTDDAFDTLSCLLKQEDKRYICPNYMTSSLLSRAISVSPDNETLPLSFSKYTSNGNNKEVSVSMSPISPLSVIEACAKLVTDLSLQPGALLYDTSEHVDFSKKSRNPSPNNNGTGNTLLGVTSREGIEIWRRKMFDWSKLVVDCFYFDREVIPTAFNILDRYVAKETATTVLPITKEDFQLFAMTSLYIAVKTVESYPRILSLKSLVGMSNGLYTEDAILETEYEILQGLGWFVNPPTGYAFCNIYWCMFPTLVPAQMKARCRRLIELAISDNYLISKRPSLIGLAAVLFAAHTATKPLSNTVLDDFKANVSAKINVYDNEELYDCYRRLKVLYFV